MSRPWVRFLSSLELKGLTFEDVQLASDRLAVIRAAGITDPLTVAIVETEWQRRATSGGGSHSSPNVSGIAGTSSTVLPTPRGLGAPGISNTSNPVGAGVYTGSIPTGLSGLGGLGLSGHLFQLKDPSELKQLPEELQDVLLTREILNAVLGLAGDFVRRSTQPVSGTGTATGFELSPAVPQPMRGICETILPVADAFVALRQVEDAEYLGKSLVAMALGEVVNEICTAYALEVSKLQQWSRDDPYGRVMPLMRVVSDITRIGHHLVRLRQVLPVELVNFSGAATDPILNSESVTLSTGTGAFVSTAQRTFLSGPRLLNHLSEQLERCGGSKEESDVLHLLLRRAMVPYLKILRRWMHEGVLEDPFGEFFITENASPSGRGYSSSSTSAPLFSSYYNGGISQQQRSSKQISQIFPEVSAAHEHYGGYRHNFASGSSSTSYGGVGILLSHQEATAFERRFSMNKLLMPSFLEKPSRIAKMIFFTGKYCCLLRECHEELPDFSSTTTQAFGTSADGSVTLSAIGGGSHIGLESKPCFVWRDVEDMHQKIQRSFELASQMVIRLLFSPKVDLLGHLTSLKIFYLHSQGDWITDFLDNADDLLSKSRDKVKGYSLRVLLQASIARCCSAHDAYHDIIGCSFSDSTLEQHLQRWRKTAESGSTPPTTISTAASPTAIGTGSGYEDPSVTSGGDGRLSAGTKVEIHRCIELLQLEADLKWPLTLVLDPTVMARFNSVFRLLTWIKVCERSLCSLWNTNEVLSSFPAAYGIKHHFIQFLRQFQFFAAHFVLEPLWSRLMSRLGPSDSLFGISQALNDFFTDVESGLMLASPTRFKSLRNVLSLVSRFCEIGRHSSAATLPLIEATLHSVQDQYLTALSELASAVGPDYSQLIPLLTCIDFNGFYDRHNVYHVQSGA